MREIKFKITLDDIFYSVLVLTILLYYFAINLLVWRATEPTENNKNNNQKELRINAENT